MTAALFEHRGQVYAVTLAPYDPMAVELIKAVVPSFARRWSPPRRDWVIDEVYGHRLAEALRRLNCTIIGLDDPTQRRHGADSAAWARAVFQRVGPTRAPLAYKLLSRACHPDHGGDHQLQLELNQAYAELSSGRKTA
jgi:hypothetical protein